MMIFTKKFWTKKNFNLLHLIGMGLLYSGMTGITVYLVQPDMMIFRGITLIIFGIMFYIGGMGVINDSSN